MKIEHLIFWTVLTSACVPSQRLDLPEPPPGTKAMILATEDPHCESGPCAFARAYAGTTVDRALTLPLDATAFYALYYEDDLFALGIPAGALEACTEPEASSCPGGTRWFPRPDTMFGAPLAGSALEPFRQLDALPSSIDRLRIPRLKALECASSTPPRCFSVHGSIPDDPDDPEERERALRCIECASDIVPMIVAPPAQAASVAPIELACPEGWSSRSLDAEGLFLQPVSTCVSEEHARIPCPNGQVQFQGESTCTPIGGACPTPGDFPMDAPSDAIFVRLGASNGDGSIANPFGTIELAIAAGTSTIVLAEGRYTLCEVLDRPLAGVCTRAVVLETSTCPGGQLRLEGSSVLRDLTVEGAVDVDSGATAHLSRLVLSGAPPANCLVVRTGSVLRADELLISHCETGLYAHSSTVALERAVIEDTSIAATFEASAFATLGRVVLSGTNGALFSRQATVRLTDGYLASGLNAAVVDGGFASLRDVSLHSDVSREERLLLAVNGANVAVEAGLFERSKGIAIDVSGDGTRVRLEDVVVRDVEPISQISWGLYVAGHASVEVAHMTVEHAQRGVSSIDSALDARGLIIVFDAETQTSTEAPTVGVQLETSTATLSDVAVHGTVGPALGAYSSSLRLTNAMIDSTKGQGLTAYRASSVNARGLDLHRIELHGVVQDATTYGVYRDIHARDVKLAFIGDGVMDIQRASIEGSDGVLFTDSETIHVFLRDLIVDAEGMRGPAIKMRSGELTIERLSMMRAPFGAIIAREMTSTSLSDLDLVAGKDSMENAVELSGGMVTVTRARIDGGGELLNLCGTRAFLTDVLLAGGRVGVVADQANVELSSFRMPSVTVGIEVRTLCVLGDPHLQASRGVVEASDVGLRLPSTEPVADALYEVLYRAPTPIQLFEPRLN